MFDVRELNVAVEMWGVAFCAIGIACALLFSESEERYRRLVVAGFSLELVACAGDAVAGVYRGVDGSLAWFATHAGNLATFWGSFLLVATLTLYLCRRLEDGGARVPRYWSRGVGAGCVAMCIATAAGLFYSIDSDNLYQRGDWYWLALAFVVGASAVNAALVIRGRRKLSSLTYGAMLFYSVLPLVAASMQMFAYGFNLVIAVGVVNMVVVFFETRAYSARVLQQRTEELARAREQAASDRIAVMVSQIQPHFLFNTLDTIYGLTQEDVGAAGEAIASFSRYLRTNLAALNRLEPVPVEREMEHVRTYLELERTSDPERVAFAFDIEATGFSVPALSIQTLAENAVRHGIGAKPEGGTVKVRTRELPDEYSVTVADDGVGFDVGDAELDGGDHIGIENTRSRLAAMCGGTLDVRSEPGVGTRAVMHIPKR